MRKLKLIFCLIAGIFLCTIMVGCQDNEAFPWWYNDKKCIDNYEWAENKIVKISPDSIPFQGNFKRRRTTKSIITDCFFNNHYQLIHITYSDIDSLDTCFSTSYAGLFLEDDTTHYIMQNTSAIIYPDSIKSFIRFVKMNNIREELAILIHKFYYDNPFSKMTCQISGKDLLGLGFSNKQKINASTPNKKYTLMYYQSSIDEHFPYKKSLPIRIIETISEDSLVEKNSNLYYLTLIYFNNNLTESDAVTVSFGSDYDSLRKFMEQLDKSYECKKLYNHLR